MNKKQIEELKKAHDQQELKRKEEEQFNKKRFPNGVLKPGEDRELHTLVMRNKKTLKEEIHFPSLHKLVKEFNNQHPNKSQPITNEILALLNELKGCVMTVAWEKPFIEKWEKYNRDLDRFPKLANVTFSKLRIDFAGTSESFDSELLLNQIRDILKDHLKREYPPFRGRKKGRGNPPSEWLKAYTLGLPTAEKLYKLGITKDFLAHFFNQDPDNFKRKIRTVSKKSA